MRALALLFALAACGPRDGGGPFDWPTDYAAYARRACLGDGAPPALGEQSSGGELAACQTLVRGGFR
jgi:hypothetical protein